MVLAGKVLTSSRYREFSDLHAKLKARYPASIGSLELPRKQAFNKLFKMRTDFVEERRLGLQTYLQTLMSNAECCRSPELRDFLCQRPTPQTNFQREFGDITQASSHSSDRNARHILYLAL